MMQKLEEIILKLVVDAGDARGKALEAVELAEKGDFEAAQKLMVEADDVLNGAHQLQTELITAELNGEEIPGSLLMIHGQDHLMNAITVRDMSAKMIQMYRRIDKLTECN